jgi:hypothetical protein
MRTNFLFLIFTTFLLTLFAGCYTILIHPDVEIKDKNGYTYNNNVKYYDDCSSCHEGVADSYIESPQILAAHPLYSNFGYFDYSDYYYNDSYFGDYGYYYNYPWWLEVAAPSYNKKSEQYSGGARNNNSERSEITRERARNNDIPSPTITPGNTETTETGSSQGTSSGTSVETRSTNSSDNTTGRNSSNTSGARNNSGERTSDSGRKR